MRYGHIPKVTIWTWKIKCKIRHWRGIVIIIIMCRRGWGREQLRLLRGREGGLGAYKGHLRRLGRSKKRGRGRGREAGWGWTAWPNNSLHLFCILYILLVFHFVQIIVSAMLYPTLRAATPYPPVRLEIISTQQQEILHKLHKWSQTWKMELNAKKCVM